MNQGVIQRTFTNVVRGRELYSFTLRGVQGFWRTGTIKPGIKEGTMVEFEADGQDVNMSTLRPLADRAPETISPEEVKEQSKKFQTPGYVTPFTKDDYWKNKEERDIETQKIIQYQAARNTAVAVLATAVSQGILALPTTKNKGYDALLKYVDDLTNRFFVDGKTQGHEEISMPEPAEMTPDNDRE